MSLPLYRNTPTEIRKVDENKYRFVISDETVDRYRTVIKVNGWQLDNYKRNPIVAYNHLAGSGDPDNIIGRGNVWIQDDKLMAEVEFEPKSMNEKADKVRQKIEYGTISTTSVGFDPKEWTRGIEDLGEDPKILYFRKQELLEFSIVDIPANPNATIKNSYTEFVEMALAEGEAQAEPIEEKRNTQPAKSLDKYRNQLLTIKLNTL